MHLPSEGRRNRDHVSKLTGLAQRGRTARAVRRIRKYFSLLLYVDAIEFLTKSSKRANTKGVGKGLAMRPLVFY